jgi:hypothetical protein
MPHGFVTWLQSWQTLIAALVAILAAGIAFHNTTRSLREGERLEMRRRRRKHAALRAVLPLALAQLTDYAERSARALDDLLHRCTGGQLPPNTAPQSLTQQLPSSALKTLADFIEYSDEADVWILEVTVAWIQIHESRLRGLVRDNHDPANRRVILPTEIEARLIDAASIYAGAAAAFDYARRRQEQMPSHVSWDSVRTALRNMQFWDDQYPNLYAILEEREKRTAGPFDRLKPSEEKRAEKDGSADPTGPHQQQLGPASRFIKNLTAGQWLAIGTWILAGATIFLALDARWSTDRQIRAYVYVDPSELFHVDGKGVLQAYSIIGNSGQTPATNVERFVGIEVLPPSENPLGTQPTFREVGVTVLGPRTGITLVKNWAQGQLNSEQSQQIRDGQLRVYLFGKVLYDDVVGGHWELDFCNAYFGKELAPHQEGTTPDSLSYGYTGSQAKPCEQGNEIKERQPEARHRK